MYSSQLSRRKFLAGMSATLALGACGGGSGGSSGTSVPGTAQAGAAMPRGLHVSIVEDSHSSRTLTWFTDGTEPLDAWLEFDAVDANADSSALSSTQFEHRVSATADPTPGVESFTHRATASDIDPDNAFRYRVGSDKGGWSDIYVVDPSPTEDWSFIHFGDHGIGELPQKVTAEVLKTPSDLVMLAGDLSYANGDQPIWDVWFEQMQPLMANRVTMTAPGNHEQKDFGGDTFKNRFTHPPKPLTSIISPGSPGSSFYSFDYNRVHFLVTTAGALIDDGTLAEEILNIEADLSLAAARRAAGEIDFIIVMQHFTIWTDQLGRSPANPTLVALEENIIVRYGVDLLVVGHDHIYQRSVPMAFGLPNPLGYTQMLVGTGGASVRLMDDNGPQIWSAATFVGIGYARYAVSRGKIAVEYFAAEPRGLADEERQIVDGPFELRDAFEIKAKDSVACATCALPPRSPQELLKDFEAISRHTRERNRHALEHC